MIENPLVTRSCTQKGCTEAAAVAFTWPGQDQGYACIEHATKLKQVSEAMGFHLQLIPLVVELSQLQENQ